jgi:positive phototaxis protein PixI
MNIATQAISTRNSTSVTERFLGFAIQSDLQALIPLDALQGAIEIKLSEILPVPQMSPYLVGIFNWRGKSTWIVDLARFMGGAYYRDRHPQHQKATILTIQAGSETIGFLVDRTISVANYDATAALPLDDSTFPAQVQSFLSGYFLDAEHQTWMLLNLPQIFRSMNFNH